MLLLTVYLPLHFAIDCDGSFLAGTYNRLAEIIIGHVHGGELQEILVVKLTLLILFAYLPPIDVSAVH